MKQVSILELPEVTQPDTSSHIDTDTTTQSIRRRSHTVGHKHGLAVGHAGVAVVGYTTGFAAGFMEAFKSE